MAQLKGLNHLKQQLENAKQLADNLEAQINGFDTSINDISSKLDPEARIKLNELRANAKLIFNKARAGKNTDREMDALRNNFNPVK